MDEDPVSHFCRRPGEQGTHRAEQHLGSTEASRAGVEGGGHQGMGIELAPEIERGQAVPGVPDGPDGQDHLA